MAYESVTESGLEGEPARVEGRTSGVLDTADAGTASLELLGLDDLAAGAAADGADGPAEELAALARLQLSWNATEVTAVVGGERLTAPRDRTDTSLVARVPSEPAGLFDVVAEATDVVVAGEQEVDGVRTTHLRASVRPRAAVDAGLGTQAQLAIAELPDLPVEIWLDRQGRPARIRYTAVLASLQPGRTRSTTTTYDYAGWGEPVDVTP